MKTAMSAMTIPGGDVERGEYLSTNTSPCKSRTGQVDGRFVLSRTDGQGRNHWIYLARWNGYQPTYYLTTAGQDHQHCTCDALKFGRLGNPDYACKHMKALGVFLSGGLEVTVTFPTSRPGNNPGVQRGNHA